jgi:hypothetical protein
VRELPFVSLRSHREVIAAKDETIRLQRETIDNLTASLKAFQDYLESLKPKPRTARGETGEIAKPRPHVNYAELDPSNQQALVDVALAELGPGKHHASHVLSRVDHIRRRILLERDIAAARAAQPGPPPPPDAIPEAINTLIEQTVAEGAALAEAS